MISYSERESRYEWSVEVQQALAFAAKCIGLRQASALYPGRDDGTDTGPSVVQQLVRQSGLVQACRAAVAACLAAIEREVWQEVKLLGRTASQLSSDSDGMLRGASFPAAVGGGALPTQQLEAVLALLVTRPLRWSALMTLLSNLMGTHGLALAEPESRPGLEQLQSAIKTLADSWCHALAEVSGLMAGRLPASAQQEWQWMQHLVRYNDAGRLHKVWSLSHGAWTLPVKRVPDAREETPANGRRRSLGSFPMLPRSGAGTRPTSAAGGPLAPSMSHGVGLKSRSALSHARSGGLALTGPMPGTPATLLVEAFASHAATAAVLSAAVGAAAGDAGAASGGSGVGSGCGVCSCSAALTLPVSSLQAVLLSTSAERAHRLASSPALLLLPAADILHATSGPTNASLRPTLSANGVDGGATHEAQQLGRPPLGGASAPAAESSDSALTRSASGAGMTIDDQARRGGPGKPPLPPLPPGAASESGALSALPKRLTQLAPAASLPRVGSGRKPRPSLPPSGSSSLLVLQLGFFLSQARRQLSSMGVHTDLQLVRVPSAGGQGAAAVVDSVDSWGGCEGPSQRQWQLQVVVARPLVSPALKQAAVQLGFSGAEMVSPTMSSKQRAQQGQQQEQSQALPASRQGADGSSRQQAAAPSSAAASLVEVQLPQLVALETAAASSGHELLRSVVACVASALEVTCAPADPMAAARGAMPVTPGQPRLLAWPCASLLLLLAAGCPRHSASGGSPFVTPAGAQGRTLLPPVVMSLLLEMVHATLLTSQGLCCHVAQLPLLYPKDARTDELCLAHSRGLALFERLHRLMEACMALLRQQWQLGVLERAAGLVPGTAPDVSYSPGTAAGVADAAPTPASTRRVSIDRAGSNGSAHSTDSQERDRASAGEAAGGSKRLLSDPANGPGSASGSFSGAVSKLKSVFRGSKVQPTGGSAAQAGSTRPSPGSQLGSDAEDDRAASAATALDSRAPSGVGRSRQRKLAMQMSWAQLLVLERVRQVLMQLRGAVADVGRVLLDAFTQGAREAYKLVPHTDWVTPGGATGAGGGAGGGGKVAPAPSVAPRASIGAERVLQGLLLPLRTCLLASGLHPQSRAFLVSGAVSVVLQVLDEQLQEASKKTRMTGHAFKEALAGGQLPLDLALLRNELAHYQRPRASPAAAAEGGEGRRGSEAGIDAEVGDEWGMGPTLETLRQQIAALEVRWTRA